MARGRNSRKNTLEARRAFFELTKSDAKYRPVEPAVAGLKRPGSEKK